MISIEGLNYTYPKSAQPALREVSLEIQAGEFLLVAGPSGSGKSTLLRCINGLVPHFSGGMISGCIAVNDIDVLKSGPQILSRHVGFVIQNPEAQAVLDHVESEIAFGLENAAISPQEMRIRVEEVLNLLNLGDLRERPLAALSGGERQRVAIAAALAFRPQILVLDEPTSQLDPQSAEDVLGALVRLNHDLGLTVLLAEHRLERVLQFVDRVVYLQEGHITIDAPVRQAAMAMPQLPPLSRLSRIMEWQPLPLTIKEGRYFAHKVVQRVRTEGIEVEILHDVSSKKSNTHSTGSNKQSEREEFVNSSTSLLLEAENIHYAYNGNPVLKGVSLNVSPGEAVALMGRNGSGKSTLLKCLVGLLRSKEGKIAVNGRSTNGREVAEICRTIAYLPQNPDDLLFAETVADELNITLHNHKMPISSNKVKDLLDQLGLFNQIEIYPRDLSVGQRQRVALGAVTITNPNLLLLDEPTRGLDYEAKQSLVAIWKRWLESGMGLLLVTHDVELVAMIADRVLILSEGELIASGKTKDILTSSPLFAPQIAKLFPDRGWITVDDALEGLNISLAS